MLVLLLLLILVVCVLFWLTSPLRSLRNKPATMRFREITKTEKSKHKVQVSIVIPAYNEEERLPIMMDSMLDFLNNHAFSVEIIIVNDASSDCTSKVALEYHRNWKHKYAIRVLEHVVNLGKGGAIRTGAMVAIGTCMLMVDADGATNFDDFEKLYAVLQKLEKKDTGVVVIGSRAHLEKKAIATRNPLRNILMHGFHFIVQVLCVKGIADTQCGFKLFNRKAIDELFPPLHIERWAFDVELLFLAQRLKYQIEEVAVRWEEIPGSKLQVISATITMLREMVLIRLCYTIGLWTTHDGYQKNL